MSALRSARRPLAIVFVLVVVLALATALLVSPSYDSPSDVVRPWAVAEYAALDDPARPAWPTRSSAGTPPTWVSTADADHFEARVTWPAGGEASPRPMGAFGPALRARPGEWVTLGTGPTRVRLNLWGLRGEGTLHARPADGSGWVEDLPGATESERQFLESPHTGQGVFVLASAEGGPVQWGGLQVYDRRTRVRLDTGSTYRGHGPRLSAITFERVRHRTPLLAVVPVAHGGVRETRLELTPGADWEADDAVRVEVVHVLQGEASRWSGGSEEVRVSVTPGESDRHVAVLSCWPLEARHRLELRLAGAGSWTSPTALGPFLIATLRGTGEALEVRLHETSSLLLFELEAPEVLPEVDNLFDLELATFHAETEYQLVSQMMRIVQAEGLTRPMGAFSSGEPIRAVDFPLDLEDVTPMEVLDWFESYLGQPVGWDRDELTFDRRHQRPLDRLRRFLRGVRDRWF